VTRLSPEAGKLGRCLDTLTVRLDASTLSGHQSQVTLAYLVAEGLTQVSEVSRQPPKAVGPDVHANWLEQGDGMAPRHILTGGPAHGSTD
jgi:hypothetical protein